MSAPAARRQSPAHRTAGSQQRDRVESSEPPAGSPPAIPGGVSSWMQIRPVGIDAHARPKAFDALRGIRANLEGAEVEVSGRTRRTPAGVFALGANDANLQRNLPIVQGRNPHAEFRADL